MPYLLIATFCLLVTLLAACGGSASATPGSAGATATPAAVNGFGTAANHPHALLAFPDHVLLLATHYGLFRSANNGDSWSEVAGSQNQPMADLMTYSLTASPLNPQRIYVLTQITSSTHKGVLGLYPSSNQGSSWEMAIPYTGLSSSSVFLTAAGNQSPDQVYIYLNELGAQGLKVSKDAGQHFSDTGKLPFGTLSALLALPGATGQLLAASSDGMARSSDGGAHWSLVKGITGGVFGMTTPGPGGPIYATGDEGVYVSHDGGKTFSLIYTQSSLGSLSASVTQPQVLYGKTGTTIYRSSNGGHTWSALPHVQGNLYGLQADPTNPERVYLSLSYPTEMYRYDQGQGKWISLTPKP